jgi:hypothetical protein
LQAACLPIDQRLLGGDRSPQDVRWRRVLWEALDDGWRPSPESMLDSAEGMVE